jgi:hypothetical protein
MASLVLVRAELFAVALPFTVPDPGLSMPNLMQGAAQRFRKSCTNTLRMAKTMDGRLLE